jgi:hypothetical protein
MREMLRINGANGYDAEAIDKANDEYEALYAKHQEAWGRFGVLDRKKYVDKNQKIDELKAELIPAGESVINTLLNSSSVTQEQADTWSKSQSIDKSALLRLKKNGYPEAELRRDMAEFYRITGGKLRLIRIENDGSRRANASGIGHFEDNVIRPDSRFNKTVLWHEMAHHLEADPAAKVAANGFLRKRRKSPTVFSLRSLTGNKGYRKDEGAYEDDFINHYIGKVYRDNTTEVWSMGIQYLAKPADAAMMLGRDPEMLSLMAGYLQSELSPAMKALQSIQDHAKDISQENRANAANKYQQAITTLSDGVEFVDDGWFDGFEQEDRDNILSRYSLNDKTAKFLGSYGGYRIFSGKFKNRKTKRIGTGFGVMYTELTGSLKDDYGERYSTRHIPTPYFIHGELQDVKAAIKIAIDRDNSLNGVIWDMFSGWDGSEARVIKAADKIAGNQQ